MSQAVEATYTTDNNSYKITFNRKKYTLPGYAPTGFALKMSELQKEFSEFDEDEEQALALGTKVMYLFLDEICPPDLAKVLYRADVDTVNTIYTDWAAATGLGEKQPS